MGQILFIFLVLLYSSTGLARSAAQEFFQMTQGQQDQSQEKRGCADCESADSCWFNYPAQPDKSKIQLCEAGRKHLVDNKVSWFDLQTVANKEGIAFRVFPPSAEQESRLTEKRRLSDSGSAGCSTPPDTPKAVRRLMSVSAPALLVRASITAQEPLMEDLFNAFGKERGFKTLGDLKDVVAQGERLVGDIRKCALKECNSLRRSSSGSLPQFGYCQNCPRSLPDDQFESEKLIISILWYLQAEAGKKLVFNPKTWNKERGFVEGGTFRFTDDNEAIFKYLRNDSSYKRPSSHYKGQLVDEQFGVDVNPVNGVSLPGHFNARTLLFGQLDNNQMFIKVETAGFDTWADKAKHIKNYVVKKLGFVKNVDHFHSENMPNEIRKIVKKYCDSQKECKAKDLLDGGVEKILLGLDKLRNENPNHPLLVTLQAYTEDICGKKTTEAKFFLIGCEAILELPSVANPILLAD